MSTGASGGHVLARSAVTVGALGVVFGDIGTSPIYTLQTVFNPSDPHPSPVHAERVRRRVAGVLVGNDHRHGHLRAARDARRQRRRGRHHGADHPDPAPGACRRAADRSSGRAGHLRRVAVLRRQHDHPGDLGAVRGRRAQGRRAVAGAPGRADHRSDHRHAVRGAAHRNGAGGPAVRAGDDRLVCWPSARSASPASPTTRRSSGRCRRPTPWAFCRQRLDRVLRPGRGRARRHRRRGALRRHGALRPPGDHPRLAGPRLPRLHPELPRPGRADPRRPDQHQQPVLPARARLGPAADGPAGHGGHRDRLPGGDHRRVLGRPPGRPARLPAAAAHRAHLGVDHRPDLRPVDQLGC